MSPLPLVSDYMARELVALSPEAEINHAMQMLLDRRLSGAPVLDSSGALVGVLSKKDCMRAALQASYHRDWGAPVSAHMTREVQTLDANLDVLTACEAFLASPFRRFPVMSEGRLVGQISRADVLRAMADLWGGPA